MPIMVDDVDAMLSSGTPIRRIPSARSALVVAYQYIRDGDRLVATWGSAMQRRKSMSCPRDATQSVLAGDRYCINAASR